MKNSTNIKLITFKPFVKKGVPGSKEVVKKFEDIDQAEKALQIQLKKGVSPIHLINEVNNTKTLFFRNLNAKNYSKKTSSL